MEDLISRAAAIDAIVSVTAFPDAEYIKNLCQNPANSEDWLGGVCDAINAVEDVNTADAMPVTQGEWIKEPDRLGHYHCSNCGITWGIIARAMKHCPNCAAKMMNKSDVGSGGREMTNVEYTSDRVNVVHGKWVWLSSTYEMTPCEMRYWCSECHHETITRGTSPWEKYCPNCGAKMDKEDK